MFNLTSNKTLITSLACAATSPGLRSMLVVDAPYAGLQQIADLLEKLLQGTTRRRIVQHKLGTFEIDEDVWGSLELPGGKPIRRIFSAERNAEELQIISIADLSTLSVTAARSYLMLVNADVVHLERNGEHACWQPEQYWIAACKQEDIGAVSPHLLERFTLRLTWQDIAPEAQDHDTKVAELLAIVPQQHLAPDKTIDTQAQQQIANTEKQHPLEVSAEALECVLDYVPTHNYYPRREITLARFAMALARLEGDIQLQIKHVEQAAGILGFEAKPAESSQTKQEEGTSHNKESQPDETGKAKPIDIPVPAPLPIQQTIEQPQQVVLPENTHTDIFDTGKISSDPYPEDSAPIEREAAALKVPFTRYSSGKATRGPIIGIEESSTLYDLAITSTILEAAKKRHLPPRRHAHRLLLEQEDLRRYKRGSLSESMLMLVLDYTSVRKQKNWSLALVPYLQMAYTERAKIVIVQVGVATSATQPDDNELRAKIISERSILVPRVSLALQAQAGRATPLAHGLELATHRLQHALQHGRNTIGKVTLVVVSDGRGNVPLAVSHAGELSTEIISRKGIEDTLEIAQQISRMKRVETVILNPATEYYPELPYLLGDAIKALEGIPLPTEDRWDAETNV